MKKAIVMSVLAGLMFVGAAKLVAQKSAPEPEKEISAKLTVGEWEEVLVRLQDGEYKKVGPIINKLVPQLKSQLDSTNQKK